MQHHKSKLEKVVVPKEKTVVKSLENCCPHNGSNKRIYTTVL